MHQYLDVVSLSHGTSYRIGCSRDDGTKAHIQQRETETFSKLLACSAHQAPGAPESKTACAYTWMQLCVNTKKTRKKVYNIGLQLKCFQNNNVANFDFRKIENDAYQFMICYCASIINPDDGKSLRSAVCSSQQDLKSWSSVVCLFVLNGEWFPLNRYNLY